MTKKLSSTITIQEQFKKLQESYDSLGVNVTQALIIFLKQNKIPYLSATYRIKDLDSFLEKIQRKKYESPFDEVEDICGIRIICYYQSDITKVCEIINQEFEILESQDKETLLEANEFGYRSYHFIVKIKKEWTSSPNYRNLGELKTEIQVRTILMHAWAEIEHKLAYKKDEDIPKQFKRQLSRISAKLEEADEQFEKLKDDVTDYRSDLIATAEKNRGKFDDTLELNLDNLQAYLDLTFPTRYKDINDTSFLLDEMRKFGITIKTLNEYHENCKDVLSEIEKEESNLSNSTIHWAQGGAVRTLFDLNNNKYYSSRKKIIPGYIDDTINKYRKQKQ